MKKRNLFIFIMVLGLCGCQAPIENDLSQVRIANSQPRVGEKTQIQRAASIRDKIVKVNGVKGVAVVVDGHTALIGIRIKKQFQGQERQVKILVMQKAREADLYLQGISITTNERITAMIEGLERQQVLENS